MAVREIADFDAIAYRPYAYDGDRTTVSIPAKIGGGVKRAFRFNDAPAGDDPAAVMTAARAGGNYQRSAPVGDRGGKRDDARAISGAAALSAVSALTGYDTDAAPAEPKRGAKRGAGVDPAVTNGEPARS